MSSPTRLARELDSMTPPTHTWSSSMNAHVNEPLAESATPSRTCV